MVHWRRILARLWNLFGNHRADNELAREVEAHLVLLADDFERRGMSPEEARLAAMRAYGGVEQAKQAHRDERSLLWMEHSLQDLRHAGRALVHSPGFTLTAIATIALGVGVNTTLFTAYNAVALKPLPVADAGSVMRLRRTLASGFIGENQYAFSYPEFINLQSHQKVFQSVIAASWPVKVLLSAPGASGSSANQLTPAQAQLVSGNYFGALGISARIGRVFGPDEDRGAGGNPVVVLSHAFWQRQYRGDPRVLGGVVRLGNTSFTIIGVTPLEFTGTSLNPEVPDLWAPVSMQGQLVPGQDWLHKPTDFQFQILSRLDPGITVEASTGPNGWADSAIRADVQHRDHTLSVVLERTAFFGNTNDPRFRAGVGAVMVIFAPWSAGGMRQCDQHARRARCGPAKGNQCPPGAGREPCPRRSSSADRKHADGTGWRSGRTGAGSGGRQTALDCTGPDTRAPAGKRLRTQPRISVPMPAS